MIQQQLGDSSNLQEMMNRILEYSKKGFVSIGNFDDKSIDYISEKEYRAMQSGNFSPAVDSLTRLLIKDCFTFIPDKYRKECVLH